MSQVIGHNHYHGVLAPNAPLRQAVTGYAGLPWGDKAMLPDQEPVDTEDLPKGELRATSSTVYLWAILMARIYEILPLVCPQYGCEMEIIAFITEADPFITSSATSVNPSDRLKSNQVCPCTSSGMGYGF